MMNQINRQIERENYQTKDSNLETRTEQSEWNLGNVDRLISERYNENPNLANKEALINMGENLVKSLYYGVTGFLFTPTAFRRDGKLRYFTKCMGHELAEHSDSYRYSNSFHEHKEKKKLEESVKIENPFCSFFNGLGAYAGVVYSTVVPSVIGIVYLCGGCYGKTALEYSIPLAATIASGAYEILRKWFLFERNRVIEKVTRGKK